ncbi:hypothetical protein D3C85_1737730 [compost metagenome]
MAHAHHDTANRDKRSCREAVLFGTKQRGNCQVASVEHFTIRLKDNTVTKIVHNQRLMCLSHTQLPRQTRMTDRTLR